MPRRVTIVDVAARAGVALSSASTALNGRPGVSEATRARVRAAADELGYVPSLRGRSLSAGRAYAVALVVQRESDVLESDPFFGAFISGIESVLAGRGYALVLQMGITARDVARRYRDLSSYRRVDGVFLNELQVDDPRIALLTKLEMPAVAINADRGIEGFPFPVVRQDGVAAVQEIVRHLVDLGHRRIGHLSGPQHFVHGRERLVAWRQAVLDAGLEPGPVLDGDFTYAGGVSAAREMIALPDRPTAVFCANDLSAVGFMRRLQDEGVQVPGDVSVVGFDGIELGTYVRPTLTTAAASPRLIGAHAATALLDLIEGAVVPDIEIEPVRLVVRASTAYAPQSRDLRHTSA
ncbi:LacI family DNA-binding transcriptional regulator [Cellulomonas sp. P24]|uniref:LacI family DNA-binding transcriptional regulator n=1 Tax=Cellulomonas sp. P24 TaxID=2885206 RepID=UPI00216ACF70|nr:LacI family DNA-binding transcriptional regulator [Cellulomonas sp. P24]MCR6491562.1 LacI family transcriptional regulator [Cellulomonas sp. P24]